MEIWKSKKEGWDCQNNEDGTTTCRRFFQDKEGNKLSNGTEMTIGADANNNCEPFFTGHTSYLDDDEKKIDQIAKRKVVACKKGLA